LTISSSHHYHPPAASKHPSGIHPTSFSVLQWSKIRGQRRPLEILQTALDTGRVHHAYLFTGQQGVGKFLSAKTLAAVVNCENRPEGEFADACGECRSCRKVSQLQHPDVLVVAPEKDSIKIAQIREIQKASNRAPYEARVRFVLIDDAHTMTEPAANALLKTLEEPSSRMRLILVTDQAHRLLPTILSRCQMIRFGGLDDGAVVSILREILEAEAAKRGDEATMPDPSELAVAAGYGEGSVGRSLAVIESGMLEGRADFIGRVVNLPAGHPVELLDLAEELKSNRGEMAGKLDVLMLFFRDVMLYKAAPGASRLVNSDMEAQVDAVAARLSMDDLLVIIDQIRQAQRQLLANVNAQLVAEEVLGQVRRRRRAR
jgi:DNA polymerase-3 subunit delta'